MNVANHPLKSIDRTVRSFPDAARKRMCDERRLENGIQDFERCMMQDTIADGCLMNAALLRIADCEGTVRAMFVYTCLQFAPQLKEVLFEPGFKLHHIFPGLFAFL